MFKRLFHYFNPSRPIGRGAYLTAGVLLLLLKYWVDSTIAARGFHESWYPHYYLVHGQVPLIGRGDHGFLATMGFVSLPFVTLGTLLTLRRLRALELPRWLVICFFPPMINLLFFAAILIRSKPRARSVDLEPQQQRDSAPPWTSVTGSALIGAGIGLPVALFSIYGFRHYGGGLFLGLPFCVGLITAVIHGYCCPRPVRGCIGAGLLAVTCLAIILFLSRLEGIMCLLMAAPLLLGSAALGACVGYCMQTTGREERKAAIFASIMLLTLFALMGAEWLAAPTPPLYEVRTSVTVATAPDAVWRNVVSFPDLPPPNDWIFSTGVAFPTRATIDGTGPGAIRRCEFSTGTFVEPIEIWDQPRLLHFSVTENPPPMREWSLGGDIHPPHLDGFMVSRAGQFLLQPLADGTTQLEGTTWYQHDLWPTAYWRLWSDFLIHRIHRRVLEHVRVLSERPSDVP